MVEVYLIIGVIVLVACVASSPNSLGGTFLQNLVIATLAVLLWPIALFIALADPKE